VLNRLGEKKMLENISRAGEADSSRQHYQTEAQTSTILKAFAFLVRLQSQSEPYSITLKKNKPPKKPKKTPQHPRSGHV